jgi:hypothetical protein
LAWLCDCGGAIMETAFCGQGLVGRAGCPWIRLDEVLTR